jgi:hypothetical protein
MDVLYGIRTTTFDFLFLWNYTSSHTQRQIIWSQFCIVVNQDIKSSYKLKIEMTAILRTVGFCYEIDLVDRVTGRASPSTHVVRLRSVDGYNIVNEHRLATVSDGLWFSDGIGVAGSRVHVSN